MCSARLACEDSPKMQTLLSVSDRSLSAACKLYLMVFLRLPHGVEADSLVAFYEIAHEQSAYSMRSFHWHVKPMPA